MKKKRVKKENTGERLTENRVGVGYVEDRGGSDLVSGAKNGKII